MRTRKWLQALGMFALLALVPGCGSGGSPDTPVVVTGFSVADLPSEVPTAFTVTGAGFGASGNATVRLVALAGTPFFGGTSATIDIPATVVSDTQIAGTSLPAGVGVFDVDAAVSVLLPGRSGSSGAAFTTVSPPEIRSLGPLAAVGSATAEFELNGRGFGSLGGDVTVTFIADSGTPFLWGTTDRIVVTARNVDEALIAGNYPSAAVAESAAVSRVEIRFPSGAFAALSIPTAPLVFEAPTKIDGPAIIRPQFVGRQFGISVSIDGDTALVGASTDFSDGGYPGSAYIYVRDGTTWIQQQRLLASDQTGAFGSSVSLQGDTALVGAPLDRENGNGAGAAYVFVKEGGTWVEQQKLVASDGRELDFLGRAVALSGDTALVAAAFDDDRGAESGSAYVFVRSGTTWTEQQKLAPSDGEGGDQFGSSVAVDGDTALVGAWLDRDDGQYVGGATYVFVRTGETWVEQQKLKASDAADHLGTDAFGASVALSGDTALVGASGAVAGNTRSGAVYVFVRDGTTWIEEHKLAPSGGANGDAFGVSLAFSGDTAVVGADADDENGPDAGAAYVFVRASGVWVEQRKLAPPQSEAFDRFGVAVSVSEDTVLVGAWFDNDEDLTTGRPGSIYFY